MIGKIHKGYNMPLSMSMAIRRKELQAEEGHIPYSFMGDVPMSLRIAVDLVHDIGEFTPYCKSHIFGPEIVEYFDNRSYKQSLLESLMYL